MIFTEQKNSLTEFLLVAASRECLANVYTSHTPPAWMTIFLLIWKLVRSECFRLAGSCDAYFYFYIRLSNFYFPTLLYTGAGQRETNFIGVIKLLLCNGFCHQCAAFYCARIENNKESAGYKGGLYEHKQKHDARSNKNKTLMLTLWVEFYNMPSACRKIYCHVIIWP